MFRKYGQSLLFFAPALMLLFWVMCLSYQVHSGREVSIRIKGYDPVSLLSGHFIRYEIDWDNTDCTQFEENVCPKADFAKALRNNYWGDNGRFYVSEKDAQALDRAVRHKDNTAEIIYSYKQGKKPYAKRLLINGESFTAKK